MCTANFIHSDWKRKIQGQSHIKIRVFCSAYVAGWLARLCCFEGCRCLGSRFPLEAAPGDEDRDRNRDETSRWSVPPYTIH